LSLFATTRILRGGFFMPEAQSALFALELMRTESPETFMWREMNERNSFAASLALFMRGFS
jgi:hypothetical protein